MSILVNAPKFDLGEMRGASYRDDVIDRGPSYGTLAVNCEFDLGGPKTRTGFQEVFTLSPGMTWLAGMFYFWHPDGIPYLVYVERGVTYKVRNLLTGATSTILDTEGLGQVTFDPVFAEYGKRLYIAGAGQNGKGSISGYVWDGDPAHQAEKCFQPPLAAGALNIGIVNSGPGEVSKGTHWVGLLVSTKSGFWTRPGPADAENKLVGVSFTATGQAGYTLTATPAAGNWPAWMDSARFVISPADKPNKFYLVDMDLPTGLGGTATPVTKTLIEADLEVRQWDEADNWLDVMVQSQAGVEPFKPKGVVTWGDRMVWVAEFGGQDCIFVSDVQQPQRLSASRHLLNFPGIQVVRSAAVLGTALYVFSETATVAWGDNGDYPVTFSKPEDISTTIGVLRWRCVASRKGLGYLLVASQDGIYPLGGGGYPSRPLTWNVQPVWDQVDWTNPHEVIVKDDPTRKTIAVTFARKDFNRVMFELAYFRGMTWDKVDFSWTSIGPTESSYNITMIELVKNPTKNVMEMWIGRISTGQPVTVIRKKTKAAADSNLFIDNNGEGIYSLYRTGKIPPGFQIEVLDYLGYALRVTGQGLLDLKAYTLDETRSYSLPSKSLSLLPGQWTIGLLNLQSEGFTLEFSNGGRAGEWFALSHLRAFYQKFVGVR